MNNDIRHINRMKLRIKLFGFVQVIRVMAGKQAIGLQSIDFLPTVTVINVTQKTADLALMRMIANHSKDETIPGLDKVLG